MAQNREKTEEKQDVTVLDAGALPESIALPARRDDSADPDAVIARVPYMGGSIAVRQGTAEKSLRGEIRAMARAARYAHDIADGRLALSDFEGQQKLDITAELRRAGKMSLIPVGQRYPGSGDSE